MMPATNTTATCSRSTIDRFSRTFPLVFLSCGLHATIASVEFASFGRPGGTCTADGLTHRKPGVCHAASSEPVLRSLCVGLHQCRVHAKNALFGGDPCPGKPKRLIAQITCSSDAANMAHVQAAATPSARSRDVPAGGAGGREEGRFELLSAALRSLDDPQGDTDAVDVEREAPPPEGESRLDTKGILAAAADETEAGIQEDEARAAPASPRQCAAVRRRVGARALGAAGCDSFCDAAFATPHCCFCKCAACSFCSRRTHDGPGAGTIDGALGCTALAPETSGGEPTPHPPESIAGPLARTAGGTADEGGSEMETVIVARGGQEARRGRGRGVGRRGRRSSKRRVMKRLARQFPAAGAPPQPEASSSAASAPRATSDDDHRAAAAVEAAQAATVVAAAAASTAAEEDRQQDNTVQIAQPATVDTATSAVTSAARAVPKPVNTGAVEALFLLLQARRARGEL